MLVPALALAGAIAVVQRQQRGCLAGQEAVAAERLRGCAGLGGDLDLDRVELHDRRPGGRRAACGRLDRLHGVDLALLVLVDPFGHFTAPRPALS